MSLYQKKEKQGQFLSMGREGGNTSLKLMKRYSYAHEKQKVMQDLADRQHLESQRATTRQAVSAGAGAGAATGAAIGTVVPVVGNVVGAAIGYGAGALAGYIGSTGNYAALVPGLEWVPGLGSYSSTIIEDVFGGLF